MRTSCSIRSGTSLAVLSWFRVNGQGCHCRPGEINDFVKTIKLEDQRFNMCRSLLQTQAECIAGALAKVAAALQAPPHYLACTRTNFPVRCRYRARRSSRRLQRGGQAEHAAAAVAVRETGNVPSAVGL